MLKDMHFERVRPHFEPCFCLLQAVCASGQECNLPKPQFSPFENGNNTLSVC